jgi:hypothetical protein
MPVRAALASPHPRAPLTRARARPHEPFIPVDMYHDVRAALASGPAIRAAHTQVEVIAAYKRLVHATPRANQYLLLYVLDLLSAFARRADKYRMDASNASACDLAVIFRPGRLPHPAHELQSAEHTLSQRVLETLIAHQDWFMADVPPPRRNHSVVLGAGAGSLPLPGAASPGASAMIPDEFGAQVAGAVARVARRRTLQERTGTRRPSAPLPRAYTLTRPCTGRTEPRSRDAARSRLRARRARAARGRRRALRLRALTDDNALLGGALTIAARAA